MFWVLVGLLDGAGGGAPPEQQVITAGRYYPIYKKPEPEKRKEREPEIEETDEIELPPIKVEIRPEPVVIRLDTGDRAEISAQVAREIRQAIEDDDEDAIAAILSVIL